MTISNREQRWLLIVAAIALLLANLPSLLAFVWPPHGTVYSGIDSTAPGDLNVYRSYMEQVVQGKFVLRDLFTSESQRPWIFSPFWIVLGLFSSLLHVSTLFIYFAARIIFGALLIFIIYRLAAELFDDIRVRKVALLLGVFGGGLGAIGAIISTLSSSAISSALHSVNGNLERVWPMDLWVSEAFTFLSLHHSPHFVAATALILLSVSFLGRSFLRKSLRDAVWAGISMLALFSFHPFHVLSLGLITVAYIILAIFVERTSWIKIFLYYVLAWLIAAPALAYQVWAVVSDPFGQARAEQNILPTPDIPTTIVSYGLLLIAAFWGGAVLLKRKERKHQLLIVWAIAHAIAMYVPIFFNRRVTQGFNIALALLAAVGIFSAIEFYGRRRGRKFSPIALVLIGFFGFGLSTVWVSAQDLSFLMSNGRTMPYFFYLSKDYRDALEWLKQNTSEEQVVLSSSIAGNFVPALSGRQVFIGHNVETLHFADRQKDISDFFDAAVDNNRRLQIIKDHQVSYVIVGPWEERLGKFQPEIMPSLVPVFKTKTVTIYFSNVN